MVNSDAMLHMYYIFLLHWWTDRKVGESRSEGYLAKNKLQNYEFSISPGSFPLIRDSTPLETSPNSHLLTTPPPTPGMPPVTKGDV